jgi:hypothetical protein
VNRRDTPVDAQDPERHKVSCPRCGKAFNGQSVGAHVWKCPVTMEELFWNRVNKNAPNGCWEWTASRKEKGYGQFFHKGKMHRAHRLAWKLSGLELPERPLELAHTCDNRVCVNPAHLFVATHLENMQDCRRKRRNHRIKFSDEQVREIRIELAADSTQGALSRMARRHGAHLSTIWAIKAGRTYKHVRV